MEPEKQNEEILEEVEIEEYYKAGKPIPPARHYKIKVDTELKIVDQPVVSGRFILSLVGKTPEQYLLSQSIGGRVKEVGPDEQVDLRAHGVERFMTLKRDPQEG